MPLIVEGILTTTNADGSVNIAPMGPIVEELESGQPRRLLFRPFEDSTTCQNLQRHPEAVFHVTDDVLLIARAVTRQLAESPPETQPAERVNGSRLVDTCLWHEVRITRVETTQPRVAMWGEVIHTGRQRDWLGFNRASFAVLEAAILVTRLHILKAQQVAEEFQRLEQLIEKTAGERERLAFNMLREYQRNWRPDNSLHANHSGSDSR